MSPATKVPKTRLTLRDTGDLTIALDQWIEQHVDELEINGGALPDDLAALLDEITAARADRADAIAHVLDHLAGQAAAAKATKDRAARRQKVWENSIAGLKAYALREVLRLGGEPIKGASATLRAQRNGQPSVELTAPEEAHQSILLAAVDTEGPLSPYVTVQRVAALDKKALGAAYEARRDVLAAEGVPDGFESAGEFIAEGLSAEFPGVRCARGVHLRVD